MSRTVKILLALVVLVGIGIWAFSLEDSQTIDDSATSTATNQQETDIPDNWETYENAQYDFAITHPPEASVQAEGAGSQNHIKFTYLGSDQATGEITDGFTFTVSSYENNDNQTLKDFAEERLENNLQAGEEVAPVEEATFNGRDAYTFTTETLGVVEHTVVENDDTYVVISSNIADPNDEGYEDIVAQMKSSLQLKEVSGNDVAQEATTEVKLALLNPDIPEGEDPDRGCDMVAMVSRDIPETEAPLTAALEELFSLERESIEGFNNFIARTNDTLSFDRAEVQNGTAHIYLQGELSGLAGVCDNPRAKIQIEETALQFATVEDVQIYLDGEPTELQPNERS